MKKYLKHCWPPPQVWRSREHKQVVDFLHPLSLHLMLCSPLCLTVQAVLLVVVVVVQNQTRWDELDSAFL